jgi:hypothetical protein
MTQKKQNNSALITLFVIPFLWLIWIPKVLFMLPEVSAWDRFIKVLWIIIQSAILAIGLNIISYIIPHSPPALIYLAGGISLYVFLAFIGIYSKRFYNEYSIDGLWEFACKVAGFLITDPETMRPGILPRILKKLPKRLIVETPGWTTAQVEAVSEELESALQMPIGAVEPLIVEGQVQKGKNIIWYDHQDLPAMVPFIPDVYKNLPDPGFCKLGLSMKGWVQLHLSRISHFLVFAMTGYGKSVQLQNILTQYYLTLPKSAFVLIDFKGGETFEQFRGINNIATVTNTGMHDDLAPYRKAVSVLQMLTYIMRERHSLIAKEGRKTYYYYGLFPIFLFIEEMREFLKGYKEDVKLHNKKKVPSYQKTAAFLIETLTAKGRSAAIHVFIGTQRFDVESGPAIIRENLPIKIGGPTGSKEGSKIIVNTEYLYRMEKVPGRMAFTDLDGSGGFIKMQVPFLDEGEAVELMYKHEHQELQQSYQNLLWSINNPYWWMGKEKKQTREIVSSLEF